MTAVAKVKRKEHRQAFADYADDAAFATEVRALLGPEFLPRLYRAPEGIKGKTAEPVRVFRARIGGVSKPTSVQVMLDAGWALRQRVYEAAHELDVFNAHGDGPVSPKDVADAVRSQVVRCYCADCQALKAWDDDRTTRAREVLTLRVTVARANGIRLDGEPENEAKLDAVLEVNPK